MVPPAKLALPTKPLNISDYEDGAWPDFIAHQLAPFGGLPVMLVAGNHETIPPATREHYCSNSPTGWVRRPCAHSAWRTILTDHHLRANYHWVNRNIDFIALDNASKDQFDAAQLKWFHSVVDRDEKSDRDSDSGGGHHRSPGSFGESHSMSESAQGQKRADGRFTKRCGMPRTWPTRRSTFWPATPTSSWKTCITPMRGRAMCFPGWIVGTAGAVRYRLPKGTTTGPKAMTDVYGYMVGTAAADGCDRFFVPATHIGGSASDPAGQVRGLAGALVWEGKNKEMTEEMR